MLHQSDWEGLIVRYLKDKGWVYTGSITASLFAAAAVMSLACTGSSWVPTIRAGRSCHTLTSPMLPRYKEAEQAFEKSRAHDSAHMSLTDRLSVHKGVVEQLVETFSTSDQPQSYVDALERFSTWLNNSLDVHKVRCCSPAAPGHTMSAPPQHPPSHTWHLPRPEALPYLHHQPNAPTAHQPSSCSYWGWSDAPVHVPEQPHPAASTYISKALTAHTPSFFCLRCRLNCPGFFTLCSSTHT